MADCGAAGALLLGRALPALTASPVLPALARLCCCASILTAACLSLHKAGTDNFRQRFAKRLAQQYSISTL